VTLAPFFADSIFRRGSQGFGLLSAAAGIGAVAGTLGLARRRETAGLANVVLESALTTAVCLVLFAWSPSYWLSLSVYALIGFSHMRQNASTNTLIQTLIPDEYRGRIMALYSMTVVGVLPLGHLAGGALAERAGARWSVFAGGALCLAAAAAFRRAAAGVRAAAEKEER
jgi:MFS family permease